VGPGDYVLSTLDYILPSGGVLVAVEGGRVVAMMNTDDCLGSGLWLSMARTDPRRRRQGVGSAIIAKAAEIARRRRHRHLRLWSNATNVPANAAARANGFHAVARFFGAYRPPLRSVPRSQGVTAPPEPVSKVLRGPVVRDLGGFVHFRWYFVKPTRELLRFASATGRLRRFRSSYLLCTPDDRLGESEWFEFQVLGGVSTGLPEGARLAAAAGAKRAFTYLPDRARYRRAAERAGYRVVPWGNHAILYERSV
jgi:GNAT superfamily N-acetyltransferase